MVTYEEWLELAEPGLREASPDLSDAEFEALCERRYEALYIEALCERQRLAGPALDAAGEWCGG